TKGEEEICGTKSNALVDLSNFALEIQMAFVQGHVGGISFHENAEDQYTLLLHPNGSYEIDYVKIGEGVTSLVKGTTTAMKSGLKQTNLIALVVDNQNIDLYMNQHHVAHT